jgi:hypothetical protein
VWRCASKPPVAHTAPPLLSSSAQPACGSACDHTHRDEWVVRGSPRGGALSLCARAGRALRDAARRGDMATVRAVLEEGVVDIDEGDANREFETALHVAAVRHMPVECWGVKHAEAARASESSSWLFGLLCVGRPLGYDMRAHDGCCCVRARGTRPWYRHCLPTARRPPRRTQRVGHPCTGRPSGVSWVRRSCWCRVRRTLKHSVAAHSSSMLLPTQCSCVMSCMTDRSASWHG